MAVFRAGEKPLTPAAIARPGRLMGHQHRYRHALQQGSGDAAKHKFEGARMSICPHNNQIAFQVGCEGQYLIADIDLVGFLLANVDPDTVTSQPQGNVRSRDFTPPRLTFGIERDNIDLARFLHER